MCVIVDVNIARHVLIEITDAYRPLSKAIYDGRLPIVHGGKLTDEYKKNGELLDSVVALDQAGLAKRISEKLINQELSKIDTKCSSDDEHIVALARASGARLLCSDDRALQEDFGSKGLVDKPRGRIYKNQTHKHLIRDSCDKCS